MGPLVKINSEKVTCLDPAALQIIVEKPKFPHYADKSKRLESFATWPESSTVDKIDLAAAGFVFSGIGDGVTCYYCGGGLRNWEIGDVPMDEHARWFPRCPHVFLVKGQDYVDKINRGAEFNDASNNEETSGGIDSSSIKHLTEMGFSRKNIEKAIADLKEKNGNVAYDTAQLFEILMNFNSGTSSDMDGSQSDQSSDSNDSIDSVELERLQAENDKFKRSQMCKICQEEKASVIFLPCGHMVACPQCAPDRSACLSCNKDINGRIKAFFVK